MNQKKVVAIHDISCIGRCSLTVVLPIISAMGVECAILPTAVLSTHTGGFTNFTFRDLTEDIDPIKKHWQSLNINFDGIYTGFLGSFEQIGIVSNFIKDFKKEDNLVVVDPVMGDDGKLYSIYSNEMVQGMVTLCKTADIIVPNLTEACFMTGTEYLHEGYDKDYVKDVVMKLAEFGVKKVVLTGVAYDKEHLTVVTYDTVTKEYNEQSIKRFEGVFHGTGDIFGSCLVGNLINGNDLVTSVKNSMDFVYLCIEKTLDKNIERRYGVCFELALGSICK